MIYVSSNLVVRRATTSANFLCQYIHAAAIRRPLFRKLPSLQIRPVDISTSRKQCLYICNNKSVSVSTVGAYDPSEGEQYSSLLPLTAKDLSFDLRRLHLLRRDSAFSEPQDVILLGGSSILSDSGFLG